MVFTWHKHIILNFLSLTCILALSSMVQNLELLSARARNATENLHRRQGRGYIRIRIPATTCAASLPNADEGYCDGSISCLSNFGLITGFCPESILTCCVVRKGCLSTVSTRISYFSSQAIVRNSAPIRNCSIVVNRYVSDVDQIRLDFLQFELQQPDARGNCTSERFLVSGNDPNHPIPVLCGSNTGQHVYITLASGSDPIRLTVLSRSVGGSVFNIKISQLRSEDQTKAPDGCLQFFTATSGTVRSFNYDGTTSQHLSSHMYNICINRPLAACILWSPIVFDISPAEPFVVNNECILGEFDHITITSAKIFAPPQTTLETICGVFPPRLISNTSTLAVNFNSDESQEIAAVDGRQGFEINYEFSVQCI